MKKILILLLCLLLTASITGCGTQSIKPIDTIEGSPYYDSRRRINYAQNTSLTNSCV